MSLKKTILDVMTHDDLKAAAEAADLHDIPRKRSKPLRQALRRRRSKRRLASLPHVIARGLNLSGVAP